MNFGSSHVFVPQWVQQSKLQQPSSQPASSPNVNGIALSLPLSEDAVAKNSFDDLLKGATKSPSPSKSAPPPIVNIAPTPSPSTPSPSLSTDTNVVGIPLGALSTKSDDLFAGDAVLCTNCKAALSSTSQIGSADGEGKRLWRCEFCGEDNTVEVADEEKQSEGERVRDYILETAEAKPSNPQLGDIVFVLDISGSMGNVGRNSLSMIRTVSDGVKQQLKMLFHTEEGAKRKVGLVVFDDKTEIRVPLGIETMPLNVMQEPEKSIEFGMKYSIRAPLSMTFDNLTRELTSLTARGGTTMGPAICCAFGMVKSRPGSSIVICTDGQSDGFFGSSSDVAFYQRFGAMARDASVTVSVVSVGSDVGLSTLGKAVEASGGQVMLADSIDLASKMSDVLSKKPIATGVEVSVILHQALQFRREEETSIRKSAKKDVSTLTKRMGAVNEDSEVTFEFEFREDEKALQSLKGFYTSADKKVGEDSSSAIESLKLPFQCQIRFSLPDSSMKCLRVISLLKPLTFDAAKCEANASPEILAANSDRIAAKLANVGNYNAARLMNVSNAIMLERVVQSATNSADATNRAGVYKQWKTEAQQFDRELQQQQQAQISMMNMNNNNFSGNAYPSQMAPLMNSAGRPGMQMQMPVQMPLPLGMRQQPMPMPSMSAPMAQPMAQPMGQPMGQPPVAQTDRQYVQMNRQIFSNSNRYQQPQA